MWDCPRCGTMGILGLPNCPQCGLARPDDVVSALVLPAKDVSAAPDAAGPPDSLAGEQEGKADAAIDPEPQAPKTSKKN